MRLAYCWAHCRRRLRNIHNSSGLEIEDEGLRPIAELYAIEAHIRGSSPDRLLFGAQFCPAVSNHFNGLPRRLARNSRAEQHMPITTDAI